MIRLCWSVIGWHDSPSQATVWGPYATLAEAKAMFKAVQASGAIGAKLRLAIEFAVPVWFWSKK